jgi:hypothetical protein
MLKNTRPQSRSRKPGLGRIAMENKSFSFLQQMSIGTGAPVVDGMPDIKVGFYSFGSAESKVIPGRRCWSWKINGRVIKMSIKIEVNREPKTQYQKEHPIELVIGDRQRIGISRDEAILIKDELSRIVNTRERCSECGSEPCFCNDVVYDGWTRRELKNAFDKVCDPGDWKAPIHARVMRKDIDVTLAAIAFFTGTSGGVTDVAGRPDVYIESDGYRNGPAGDH